METWREERDRLVKLLAGIESGTVTHVDTEDQRELQRAIPSTSRDSGAGLTS